MDNLRKLSAVEIEGYTSEPDTRNKMDIGETTHEGTEFNLTPKFAFERPSHDKLCTFSSQTSLYEDYQSARSMNSSQEMTMEKPKYFKQSKSNLQKPATMGINRMEDGPAVMFAQVQMPHEMTQLADENTMCIVANCN